MPRELGRAGRRSRGSPDDGPGRRARVAAQYASENFSISSTTSTLKCKRGQERQKKSSFFKPTTPALRRHHVSGPCILGGDVSCRSSLRRAATGIVEDGKRAACGRQLGGSVLFGVVACRVGRDACAQCVLCQQTLAPVGGAAGWQVAAWLAALLCCGPAFLRDIPTTPLPGPVCVHASPGCSVGTAAIHVCSPPHSPCLSCSG